MQNTRTHVEKRIARLVATAPPLTTHPVHAAGRSQIDVVYLDSETPRHLHADRNPPTEEAPG